MAGIALFTAPKVTLNISDEPPIAIAQPDTIKEVVQKRFKREKPLRKNVYRQLRDLLIAEAKEVGVMQEDEK